MGVHTEPPAEPPVEPPAERPVEQPVEQPASYCLKYCRFLSIFSGFIYGMLLLSAIAGLVFALVKVVADSIGDSTIEKNTTGLVGRATPTQPAVTMPSGIPLFDLPRRHVGEVPYGVPIFTCANPGQIALTFNNGPSEYTHEILDALDHYDFKGTFFIAGSDTGVPRHHNHHHHNSSKEEEEEEEGGRHTHVDDMSSGWPDLLSRMHESGHQIASHTYTRAPLDGLGGTENLVNEMVYNEMALRNAFGLIPAYMRPPTGAWRDPRVREQLEGLGYHVILHDVDTRDYENDDDDGPEGIQRSVDLFNDLVRIDGNGSYIVQMQDSRRWTARKLVPDILESMAVRGYKGVTVGECLDDAFFYWYRQPEP